MANELAVKTEQQALQQSESAAIMSVIERVAMSPDADINKLERMLDMQERVLDRNAKQAFTADLAAMQIELPRVIEHGEGHNKAKYALLEDINDMLRPVLHKFGFAVTFRIKNESGLVWVTTVLSHRQGHSEETSIPLALDTSGSKNAVQAVGSSISYGKRYGICAMLNISTGDDVDGNTTQAQPEIKTITKDQMGKIIHALNSKGITVEAFCKGARINRLDELEALRFQAALNHINDQKRAAS